MSYEERDSNLFKSARVNHSETNRTQRLEIHIIALGRPATSGEPSAAVRPSSRQKSAKQTARSELCRRWIVLIPRGFSPRATNTWYSAIQQFYIDGESCRGSHKERPIR